MIHIRYSDNKKQDRFLLFIITFIILTFIGLTIIGAIVSNVIPNIRAVTEYDQGWTDADGNTCDLNKFKSTTDLTRESHFVYRTLQASEENLTLIFRARNMFIRVYSDNTLIYEEDMNLSHFFGSAKGSEWHMISLPAHHTDIQLSIECITVYGNTNGILDNMYIGQMANVLKRVISLHLIGFIVSNVILCISVALICVYIYLHHKRVNDRAVLYLGITVFFAALWSSMETLLWQLFGSTAELTHLLSYLSLIILPIPLSLMGYEKLEGRQKYFCKLYFYICAANFMITSVLHFSGIREFHYTIRPTYGLFAVLIVVAFMLVFHYTHNSFAFGNRQILLIGVALVSISAVLEIIRYLMGSYGNYSSYTRIGILIIVVCFTILYANKLLDILRKNAQADMIHQIALTDAMTQLYNRTALREDESLLITKLQHHQKIGIIQFDVNNLKPVNDIYGHETGDQLIIAASKCILNAFSPLGKCYRIGGDEFLVILSGDTPEKDYQKGINAFEKLRQAHNLSCSSELHLDIAHGFIADADTDLKTMMKAADSLMYENKRALKKQV